MPRQTVKIETPEGSLTAAAISYPGKGRSKSAQKAASADAWQKDAWKFYDEIGELRYGANWVANVGAQSLLYAGRRGDDGNIIRSSPTSVESVVLDDFFGGIEGQRGMLRSMGLHLTVAGEGYFVLREPFEDEETEGKAVASDGSIHECLGTEEIGYSGDAWYIIQPDGTKATLTETDVVVRVWLPHPKDRSRADSPVRGILGTLAEIRLYDAHIRAQATSRLLGGGVLFMPSEMTLRPPLELMQQLPEGEATPDTADVFMWTLIQAMEQAKSTNGDPSSVAPIVVTGPSEAIDKAHLMTFWSELDEKVIEMRQDAIIRLARGMDLPPEIFLGTGEMNRWGAWQVEESSIKAHVEPVLAIITTAITVKYLRAGTGIENAVVEADTSKLRLRPNRSKEAVELYDRGVLNREALIRETGFAPEDLSDDEELRRWILLQMIKSSWSPDQAQSAAKELGVDLKIPLGDNAARQARPTPSLAGHPTRDRPKDSRSDADHDHEKDAEQEAAAAAVSVLAFRAMERAGNRLKSLSGMKPEGVRSTDVHMLIQPYPDRIDDLLKDAWDLSSMDHVDPAMCREMAHIADMYCRNILLDKKPFSSREVRALLTKKGR